MSKELPYFKFEPSAWDTGNIQMCSRESKGIFIDICSLYWSRLGELPYALALQKLCNGNKDALQELINHEIIGVIDGQIVVQFLDEQLSERGQVSTKRREAAQKRWADASALQMESKSNAKRREESRIEEKKREEITAFAEVSVWPTFEDFWDKYDKKVGKPKSILYWKKINQGGREKIMQHLERYVPGVEQKFRKDPERYLKYECWNDEIITEKLNGNSIRSITGTNGQAGPKSFGDQNYDDRL